MQRATTVPAMDTELVVLTRAASAAIGTAPAAPVDRRVEATTLDWESLSALAERHWLLPHLDAYLDEQPALDPPAALRSSIAEDAASYHRRNLQFAAELHRLVERFEDAGVRAIPFKGPVLAEVAYGALGRRSFGDLDFFVRPADLPEAAAVLEATGRSLATDLGPYDLDDATHALGRRSLPFPAEVVYTGGEQAVDVELRLSYGAAFGDDAVDVESLWRNRATVDVAGRAAPALSPTDRVVELSNHGAKHSWRRLEWIASLAGALQNCDVDWQAARRRARRRGVLPELHLGVAVARTFFDVDVPDDVERAARSERVDDVASSIRERYASDPMAFPTMLDDLQTRGRLHDDTVARHLRYVSRPKPEDYGVVPLPEPLWPLYHLVRLCRGSKRFLGNG